MSTDLYGIRILEKDSKNKRVKVRVFVVYYDVAYKQHQPIPYDKTFFFRILRDSPFYNRQEKMLLEKIVDLDDFLNESWVNNNAYKFVEKVEQISTKNFPIDDWSSYHDFYYERNGKWADEDKLVQADYNIYVTDSVYIHHLEVGDSWGTTSYETEGINANANYNNILPNFDAPYKKLTPFEDGKQEDSTVGMFRFSNNGKVFFTLSQANELVAYETLNWNEIWRKKFDGLFGYLYNANEQVILINDDNIHFHLDINTGTILEEKQLHYSENYITSKTKKYHINFRNDSQNASLKNINNEEILNIDFDDIVNIIEFSNDDKYLAIGTEMQLQIWDIEHKNLLYTLDNESIYFDSVSFDDSGNIIVYNNLKIIDIRSKKNVLSYPQNFYHLPMLNHGVYSPNNHYFAMGFITNQYGYDGYINIYKLQDKHQSKEEIRLAEINANLMPNNISDI